LNAQALIKEAANCGVRVNLKGDRLALNAVTKPSASLLAKLQQHKTEIVALLRQKIGFTQPEPDEAELGERKGMSMDSVPDLMGNHHRLCPSRHGSRLPIAHTIFPNRAGNIFVADPDSFGPLAETSRGY
jgi:hypothetical protein